MLEDLVAPSKIRPCMISTVLSGLEESDQKILKAALADYDSWSHRALGKALGQKGLPLGEKIIRDRRARPCSECVCRVD